jgi:DNA-binding CsgD family transcriptional regulator
VAKTLIAELTRSVPTLLIVDDVQWLDQASATAISLLVNWLPGSGVGVLCAATPGTAGCFEFDRLPSYDLAPLGEGASEMLLTRRFRELAARVRRRVAADAQGNALALLELPGALTEAQRCAAEALPEHLMLSRRLLDVYGSPVADLPAVTRHLLLIAALEGGGDLRVLSRAVAGRCDIKRLAPAEHAQLVRVDQATGQLRFHHPLTRSAVVQLSSSDQRRAAHRALADALATTPDLQAWHRGRAATGHDEQIAALLDRATVAAGRRGDGSRAVAAMVLAADLSPEPAARARRLAEAAYLSAVFGGDLNEVSRLLADARLVAPSTGSPAAAVADSACLLIGMGELDTAHKLLADAVARAPEQRGQMMDARMLEALYAQLMVCFYGGRVELLTVFDETIGRCAATDPLLTLARSLLTDPARATSEDLTRLDAEVGHLIHENDPVRIVRTAMSGVFTDRLAACVPALERAAKAARTGENGTASIHALFLLGFHALLTGQWPQMRRTAAEVLELCEEHSYPMLAWLGRYLLAYEAAARGDEFTAGALADQIEQWAAPRRAEGVRAFASHARALCALTLGDYESAFLHASVVAPAGTLPSCRPQALWLVLDLVDAAVRTSRRDEARAHVAAAEAANLGRVSPRLRMLVLAATALASDDETHPGLAEALAVEGAERWPFDLARIRLYHGERLRRGKNLIGAREQFLAAAQSFTALGAGHWAERALLELRACRGRGPIRERPETLILSPQQLQIADLAAGGLTNKQIGERLFLSPRTVASHLYRIFPMLGVSSRAALRDALENVTVH